MTPTSDLTLNQALRDLSLAAVTPSQRAAFNVVEAAVEVLACELGRAPVADTRAEALKVLAHNLALLVGDDVGTTQIPARYDTGDRETWDRIRDLLPGRVAFASGCLFNVVKYLDRAGKKGPADQDETKALFNLQGAAHVLVGLPDPRHRRPTFRPWTWNRASAWPVRVYDLLDRLDGVGAGQGREAWKAMLDVLYVHTRRDHGGSP